MQYRESDLDEVFLDELPPNDIRRQPLLLRKMGITGANYLADGGEIAATIYGDNKQKSNEEILLLLEKALGRKRTSNG